MNESIHLIDRYLKVQRKRCHTIYNLVKLKKYTSKINFGMYTLLYLDNVYSKQCG